MKKAFSTLCCLDYSLDEILELAESCQMDAIELRVDDRMLDNIKDAASWGQKVREKGIKVCDLASSIFILDGNLTDKAAAYVNLARDIGADAVRIFAGRMPTSLDNTELSDLSEIASALRKLCEIARDAGIEVWLETHSEFSTGKRSRELVDTVGMPNLKILWDVLHSLEFGESLDESLVYIGKDLAHVHVKDARLPVGDAFVYPLCDLGDGVFPLRELIDKLKAVGYDGYISLEWESPWCPEIRDIYKDPHVLLERYNKYLLAVGV